MKKIYLLSASILCIIGCNKSIVPDENVRCASEMTLSADMAQFEHDTKTSISGANVNWTAGDAIEVYSAGGFHQTFTLSSGSGTTAGNFTGLWDSAAYGAPVAAFYPASECTGYASETGFTVNISNTQAYAEGTVGNGAFPMVGTVSAEGSIAFKNAFGVLKLSLKGSGNVCGIVLTDYTNPLAGVFTIATDGTTTKSATVKENCHKVFLTCAADVALSEGTAKDFYIAVPAGTLSAGFDVQVLNGKGHPVEFLSTTKTANTIVRNAVTPMPEKTGLTMSKLPAGYTEVASLTQTGNGTVAPYIDPDYDLTDNTKIEVKAFVATPKTSWHHFCGYYGDGKHFDISYTSDSNYGFSFRLNGSAYTYCTNVLSDQSTKYPYTVNLNNDGGKASFFLNGLKYVDAVDYSLNSETRPVGVFDSLQSDGSPYSTTRVNSSTIYYCLIYDGATIRRNLIPCIKVDVEGEKPGMYDLVNDEFYTNACTTSSDFTYTVAYSWLNTKGSEGYSNSGENEY